MNLIIYKVMELEIVHDTDGYGVIECFARSAIVKNLLAVYGFQLLLRYLLGYESLVCELILAEFYIFLFARFLVGNLFIEFSALEHIARENVSVKSGKGERLCDIAFLRTVEGRRHDLEAEMLCGDTEMHLEHLTDIHSGRNAQRIQHDIERRTVCKIRHILGRKYARNDTFVTVASRHLVADGNLSLLRDIDADRLVYAGRKLIGICA